MEQLTLPYEEITVLASRDYLRESFTRSSREVYKIPFENLQIREGFNKRVVYDGIDELASSIKSKGLQEPLYVDVLPDGRVFIDRGHRRYKALQMLRDAGEVIDVVDCYPNPKTTTEKERMEAVYNSNMYSSKLKPIEQAAVVFDLKNNFGKVSNQDIADGLGISRQKVDYLLLIASAGDDVKHEILKGDMGIAEAVSHIRAEHKAEKQSDKAELDANKTSAAPLEFPKDELAGEIKELEELEGAQRMSAYNPDNPTEKKEIELVGNKIQEEEPEEKEDKPKFDENREEIKQINNCIKLADKLENIVNKLDVPEGTKKDVADIIKWMQNDLDACREWIHKNKKQNKIR